MNHEQIVEVAGDEREYEGDQASGNEKVSVSLSEWFSRYLIAATGDKQQSEEILAEEVERIKDFRIWLDVKADEKADEREGQTGP